jgi:IclR family acetate operon transcriptional repressor
VAKKKAIEEGGPAADPGAQTVHRAISVLEVFSPAQPSWSLTEVAAQTGLSISTAHRLLKALQAHELVMFEPSGKRYSLGPGIMRFARMIMERDEGQIIYDAGVGHLSALRAATGETVGLHRRIGTYRACVAELVSPHPVRTQTSVGGLQPLYAGAGSKVLIAWMTEGERNRVLPDDFAAVTSHTLTSRAALEADLARVRTVGCAVSLGESVEGAAALAAPIFDGSGTVVAAINITGPLERWTTAAMAAHLDAVLDAVGAISAQLGYAGSIPPNIPHIGNSVQKVGTLVGER